MPLAAFPKCFLDALCVTREMTVAQWIDSSARFDVDGLEFYWGFTPSENPLEWDRLRGRVEAQGRSIPMLCYSSDFTKLTLEERKAEIEQQKKAIRAAAGLGASFCRVLSGQRRPGVSREEGLLWVRECIEALIPFASEHRVTLIIENHYKDGFWEYPEFAQKMDVFLKLLASIPESPWFGVNMIRRMPSSRATIQSRCSKRSSIVCERCTQATAIWKAATLTTSAESKRTRTPVTRTS